MDNYLITTDRSKLKFDPKFYIKDNNNRWVDFSDRSGGRGGINALLRVGTITHKIEKGYGALVTKIQNVVLDNRTGFFGRLFPVTLRAVDQAQALFSASSGYKRSIIRGKECRVSVQIRLLQNDMHTTTSYGSMDTIHEEILGVFWIDDVIPNIGKGTITLKLVSPDHRLQKKDASGVRDGYGPHQYKSVSNLLEEILRSEFIEEGGTLPTAYNIDRTAFLDTIDGSTAISILGRPPRWDGSVWRNDGLHTRAIMFANSKLYLGCDDQLWEYDPTDGTYTLVYDFNSTGYYVKEIFYENESGTANDKLIIMLWKDEYWGNKATGQARTGWDFKMYTWTVGSGSSPALRTTGTPQLASLQYRLQPATYGTDGSTHYRTVGTTSDGSTGENIFVPFTQQICMIDNKRNSPGTWGHRYLRIDYTGETIPTLGISLPEITTKDLGFDEFVFYLTRGNYSYNSLYTSDVAEQNDGTAASVYVGQRPCVFFPNYTYSGKKYVYFFRFTYYGTESLNYISSTLIQTAGTKWVEMVVYSTDGSFTTSSIDFPIEHSFPTCVIKNYGEDTVFCFYEQQYPAVAPASTNAGLVTIDITALTTAPFTDEGFLFSSESTTIDYYWTVIAGAAYSDNTGVGGDKFLLCLFNRFIGNYILIRTTRTTLTSTDTLYTSATILRTSNMPYTSFVSDEVDDVIYCFGTGEGKIYKDTGTNLTTLNEAPISTDESGILSNLTVNQDHAANDPDVYGITSPGVQLESFRSYQEGKYNLFRVSSKIGDIVENADFTDMTKMQVIKDISQVRDGLSFFDRHGFFNYVARVYSSGIPNYYLGDPPLFVGLSGERNFIPIKNIQLGYGYGNVFNVVKAKTYRTTFQPPDSNSLTLLERPKEDTIEGDSPEELPFIDYIVEQRDTGSKTILCYCVRGGSTTDGKSRWKYSIIQKEIEAQLVSDATSGATAFSLASVFGGDDFPDGIHTGDFATIVNPDTGAFITRGITAVTEASNQITINNQFGVVLKKGAVIKIQRAHKIDAGYGKTEWSDEGVTYLSSNEAEDQVNISVASTKDLSIGTIVRFGDSLYEYRITDISDTTSFDIVRDHSILEGIGSGLVEALTTGDKVYAYYSPKAADGSEIGTSKIFVTWLAGTGTAEVDYTATFIRGDRLNIRCPGLSLEEDSKSLQVVIDSVSTEKHGREEYLLDNKFISRDVAKELIRRILFYYAEPRFEINVTIPLTPYIDMVTDGALTQVSVRDPIVFSTSHDNSEVFLIEGIKHDLKNALTILSLRGIDAY